MNRVLGWRGNDVDANARRRERRRASPRRTRPSANSRANARRYLRIAVAGLARAIRRKSFPARRARGEPCSRVSAGESVAGDGIGAATRGPEPSTPQSRQAGEAMELVGAVTDDFALDHEDDVLGDVGGEVGDALEVA